MMMRRAVTLVVLVLSSSVAPTSTRVWADNASAANVIKVVVVDFHSNKGQANCALFGSADGFPETSAKAIKTTNAKIEKQQALCGFSGVAPGDYAVAVFHDENSNGRLERNFMGIPKEGVGASNDAKGKFGPPKFDDARFNYGGGSKTLTIHVQYLISPL